MVFFFFWAGVFVLRRFGSRAGYSPAALGFSRPRMGAFAGAGLGFLVGLGALVVSWVLNALTVVILRHFGYGTASTVQQPFMRGLRGWVASDPAFAVPAIIAVVVLFGPAVEELVFRGAIFNGLRNLGRFFSSKAKVPKPAERTLERFWLVLAALASSVFFALLHLEPTLLPALVVLALALCYLFEKSRSLLPSFVAHATFNSFATALIILSGLGVFRIPV